MKVNPSMFIIFDTTDNETPARAGFFGYPKIG